MPFEIRSGVRQVCALSPTLFNYIIDWILGQALQDYPGVQVGANVHVSDLAYADDILLFSSSYGEMRGLFDAVNRHAAAVGMNIYASMFGANGQGTEEIRSRINLSRSAFSSQQSSLWSRREISLRTKGRVYQAVVSSILLYGCETWPVRVADERMLEVFNNDSIRRILRVRRRDCVPSVELRRHLSLTSIPALLVQRSLRWFCHAARHPEVELIKDLLLPTPPRTWRRRAGGQLKTWATTIKAELGPISGPRVFGHARWRKDRVKLSSGLEQDRRDWSASVRDVVNAIGDAGSTRPG